MCCTGCIYRNTGEVLLQAAPMLQDLGAGEALGSGVKAQQSYDTVREQVMDVDEKGRRHYDRIAKSITQYWL